MADQILNYLQSPQNSSVDDGRRLLGMHTLASQCSFIHRQLVGKVTVATVADQHINEHHSRNLRSNSQLFTPSVNINYVLHSFKYSEIQGVID